MNGAFETDKFLPTFLQNISSTHGNPLSTYSLLVKEQLPDFFTFLDRIIYLEKTSDAITGLQNRIFPSVFGCNQFSLIWLLFADNSPGNGWLEIKSLPLTMRQAFQQPAQASDAQQRISVNLKEFFLIKFFCVARKHKNNFWWKNFFFAATEAIFDLLIIHHPHFVPKSFSLFEHVFVYELEIVAFSSKTSLQGLTGELEILQLNEPLFVLYTIYLSKYKAFLRAEVSRMRIKKDQHVFTCFKLFAKNALNMFTFLFKIEKTRSKFSFRQLEALLAEFLEPLGASFLSDDFSRLYLEYNYPLLKSLQSDFILFAQHTPFEEEKDLDVFEKIVRFLVQVDKFDAERGSKLPRGMFGLREPILTVIYKKAAAIADGPKIKRSLQNLCALLNIGNYEAIEKEVMESVLARNAEVRRSEGKQQGNLAATKVRFDWNFPFNSQTEFKVLFYFWYYFSLACDFLLRAKSQEYYEKGGLKIYKNGRLSLYKNPLLKGKRLPLTNLRFLAQKKIWKFLFWAVLAFVVVKLMVS